MSKVKFKNYLTSTWQEFTHRPLYTGPNFTCRMYMHDANTCSFEDQAENWGGPHWKQSGSYFVGRDSQCLSSLALKELIDGAVTISSGRLFQSETILWEKNDFLTFNLENFVSSFSECPLVWVISLMGNIGLAQSKWPWRYLYVSIMSPRLRLCSRLGSSSFRNRSG